MSIPNRFVWLLVSGLMGLYSHAYSDVHIAYPPDHSAVESTVLQLVGTCDEPGPLKVTVKGGKSMTGGEIPVNLGGFTLKVQLGKGENTITLTSSAGNSATVNIRRGRAQPGEVSWKTHQPLDGFDACTQCHRVRAGRTDYRRMGMGTNSCRTGECHAGVGLSARYSHGPAAGGVCISCHNPHGSTRKAVITRGGAKQCYICHQDQETEFARSHRHAPLDDETGCNGCHDPHESDYKYQLREEGDRLCYLCHDKTELLGGPAPHEPVRNGDCLACHEPHAGDFSYLLMAEGNDVCFSCHEEKRGELERLHVHDPAADNCLDCHPVHGGEAEPLLAASMPGLCTDCHGELEETLDAALVKHPPVSEGRCGACHEPHGSTEPALLLKTERSLCADCHEDVGERLATAEYFHGPVEDGDCGGCHEVHGGQFPTLLNQYFPPRFYNPYQEDLYALCFECHNADIARDPETTTLTDFRDGKRNLHYLHVNRRKGRSCKACHEVHASDQPKHVRRAVPFGRLYEYPIFFTKTADGGSCQVGCHKPYKYSRSSGNNPGLSGK